MNREALKALELSDEQVNGVMKLYGKAIVELQNGLSTAQTDSENAKAELKKYQQGGELYQDPAELKRLKAFEKDKNIKDIALCRQKQADGNNVFVSGGRI